jgi:hypothetical protein
MLFMVHDPGKGNSRLLAEFQIQQFSFRFGLNHNQKRKQLD